MHLTEVFSRARAKRKKGLNDFIFGTFIGRFRNVGAASMAVKGLKLYSDLTHTPNFMKRKLSKISAFSSV